MSDSKSNIDQRTINAAFDVITAANRQLTALRDLLHGLFPESVTIEIVLGERHIFADFLISGDARRQAVVDRLKANPRHENLTFSDIDINDPHVVVRISQDKPR